MYCLFQRYFDLYWKTGSAHIDTVKWMFEQFEKHNLYANLQEYRFSQKKIRFFGYIISPENIRMVNDKIKNVRN